MAALILLLSLLGSMTHEGYWLRMVKAHWVRLGVVEQTDYIFQNHWQLAYDLETVELRLGLPTDSPPAVKKHTLPSQQMIDWAWQEQRRFEQYLEAAYPYRNYAEQQQLQLLLDDLKWRQQVWLAMDRCLNPHVRLGARSSLAELRDLLGADDFDNHRWPAVLPDAAYNSVWDYEPDPIMETP